MAAERLFVAVWPDVAVRAVLSGLPRPAAVGVRWTRPEQWHVTLEFLGVATPDPVVEALGQLRSPPISATLGPTVQRLGGSVVCVPVDGLDGLAASVTGLVGGGGRQSRPFRGHLTLARLRDRARCPLIGEAVCASWLVDEVALVRSTLDRHGATYDVLARFPLDGRAEEI